MKNCGARKRLLLVGVAMLLAVAAMAVQQEKTPSQPGAIDAKAKRTIVSAKAQAESPSRGESEASPSGPQEGIKVHGHWTIVVRNADGSVSSRHEFANSLMPGGQKFLAALLARQAAPFIWLVAIDGLCGTQARVSPCYLGEPALANDATAVSSYGQALFPVLSVSAPTAGADAGKFIMTGSATATLSSQVSWVETYLWSHSASTFLLWSFTHTNLSQQSITVQAGQSIDVTVVISFS